MLILLFETKFLILLEEKLLAIKQDKASRDAFFIIYLIFWSNLDLKISHQKLKNVTWGGRMGQKSCKKCHVLIECPPTAQQNLGKY
jgi:hypothetical protein